MNQVNHDLEGPSPPAPVWHVRIAAAWLAVLLAIVYGTTLYPGVWKGDSAELQCMSALLGVCHPPGYGLEVVVGNAFAHLPVGPNVAWRINLMQAVFGVLGGLLFFGIVRRFTGSSWAALVAAATLGLSAVYWRKSVLSDVYVFYGAFLLLGIYALLRFLQGGRRAWFFLAALACGIAVCNRPSEALVMPGLAVWWWLERRQVRVRLRDWGLALLLAVLPLAFNVGWFMVRERPELLHARDDALRDRLLGQQDEGEDVGWTARLVQALRYCTGLEAAGRETFTEFSWQQMRWDASKLGWHISGIGLLRDRYAPDRVAADKMTAFLQKQQGHGASVTVLGLLLALTGLWSCRRRPGLAALAGGLIVGNVAYYFYMHPVDNLDFLLPALIGVCLLAGAGLAGWQRWGGRWSWGAALVPLILLTGNYRWVSPRGVDAPEIDKHMSLCRLVKVTPLPRRTVILASYSRAQTLRHLYWVETPRRDVHVFIYRERFEKDVLLKIVRALRRERYTVLLSDEGFPREEDRRRFAAWTPTELAQIGLYYAYPRRFHGGSTGRRNNGGGPPR